MMALRLWDNERNGVETFVGETIEDISQTMKAHAICRMRNNPEFRKYYMDEIDFIERVFTPAYVPQERK